MFVEADRRAFLTAVGASAALTLAGPWEMLLGPLLVGLLHAGTRLYAIISTEYAALLPEMEQWAMATGPKEKRGGSGGRRGSDFKDEEARMLAQQASDDAREALQKIDKHMAVCETDNVHIKATLSNQNKLLYSIIALLLSGLGAVAFEYIKHP